MTHEDLEKRLTELVQAARDTGMSDESIIDILQDHAFALREGLS